MQKYKVFINDKWIFFEEFISSNLLDNELFKTLDASNHLLFNLSEMIKLGNFDQNIIIRPSAEISNPFEEFLNYFQVLEAAGGIVQHSNSSYLMIKRFGLWDFPKGKIEKRESNFEAALREVEEETAVRNLKIVKQLPISYHIYSYKGKWIVKRTYWYLMRSDFNGDLIPQLEEDILEAVWVPEEQVHEYLEHTYDSLRALVYESDLF